MADALQVVGRSLERDSTGQGVVRSLIGTPDGSLFTADYVLSKALEGRIFHAILGGFSTPTTFRVAIDEDQPEMVIDVPTGTTIIPISIQAHLEASAGTITEIVALANPALVGGTATTGTLLSSRLGSGRTSSCVYRYTYSGNGTAPASYIEFWHAGVAFADAVTEPTRMYAWDYRNAAPVVIVGPGALVVHIGATGTAPTGYAQLAFMEFASAMI